MQYKAAPEHTAVAQHHREQPEDPLDARGVGEDGSEMREIHLRPTAGRGLESNLERCHLRGPELAQQVDQDGVTAGVAEIAQFAMQSTATQLRKNAASRSRRKGSKARNFDTSGCRGP